MTRASNHCPSQINEVVLGYVNEVKFKTNIATNNEY